MVRVCSVVTRKSTFNTLFKVLIILSSRHVLAIGLEPKFTLTHRSRGSRSCGHALPNCSRDTLSYICSRGFSARVVPHGLHCVLDERGIAHPSLKHLARQVPTRVPKDRPDPVAAIFAQPERRSATYDMSGRCSPSHIFRR